MIIIIEFDEKPYEIIDGKVCYMSPGTYDHAKVISNLAFEIKTHLKNNDNSCDVFSEGLNIYLKGPDSNDYVIPDVVVICDKSKRSKRGYEGVPSLMVEVLSPKTFKRDRVEKLELYQSVGVKEYWIVSIGDKYIEQLVLENGVYKIINISFIIKDEESFNEEVIKKYSKITAATIPDLTIDLSDIFQDLL